MKKINPKWNDLKLRRYKLKIYYNTKNGYRKALGFDTNSKGLKFKIDWLTFEKNI